MLQRRVVNSTVILAFFVFLVTSVQRLFSAVSDAYGYLWYPILAVPLFFLFREARLWFFRNRMILLRINFAVIILMFMLAAFSFALYFAFDLSSQLELSIFYLLCTFLLPVLGIISADQYIIVQKRYIVFNLDKRWRIKKTGFEFIESENGQLTVHYSGKKKTMRLGRNRGHEEELLADFNALLDKFSNA